MAQLNFDASKVDPTNVFEIIPKADYPMMIVDSEMKDTNDKTGKYLQLNAEVIDGPYKGRIIFERLNLVNKNSRTVEIAQRQLSQICHAIGVLNVQDSAQLHNRPFIGSVDVEAGNPKQGGGKYSDKNVIKSFKPFAAGASAAVPVVVTSAHTASAVAPTAAGSPPPWAKKSA